MSLKAFHLVFITFSILLTLGFGLWGVHSFWAGGPVTNVVLGLLSWVSAAGLVLYEKYFLKKSKNISYL